ncbi:MAG TPA: SDR family oxidoreductase [Novosphingobium sp.]
MTNSIDGPGSGLLAGPLDRLFSLTGQVALVTGAARGLGFEMARALAAAGACVALGGRDPATLEAAVQRLRHEGGRATALPFDMDDASATERALARLAAEHGRLDILVANAGIRDRTGFAGLGRESFARLLHTNLVATTDLAQRAALQIAAGGRGGRVIVVGSMVATRAVAADPGYLASKAGLSGMVLALAAEYGSMGITVNELAPGPFATEYNAAMAADPASAAIVQSRTLLGRWGRPEEIAAAALFLASPGGAFVTGQRLVIDGGMTVKA